MSTSNIRAYFKARALRDKENKEFNALSGKDKIIRKWNQVKKSCSVEQFNILDEMIEEIKADRLDNLKTTFDGISFDWMNWSSECKDIHHTIYKEFILKRI